MSSHNHNRTPNHVVILGGGITGLSAAFHLARKHPTVQITLVEKSARFGGWVRSERIKVHDSDGNRGSVLLEAGPRTIRPNAKSVLELIHLLDLREEVICTPRSSPAARNRFLHVPPAQGLHPLPSGLLSLLTLPLGRLVLRSVLAEPFVPANRPPPPPPAAPLHTAEAEAEAEAEADDESVDSFLARRFGDAFARTLGSALVHGIHAADSRILSVRAAFPALCALEARGKGSVVWGALGPPAWFGSNDDAREEEEGGWEGDGEWEARLRAEAALFSFREGVETIVRALVGALRGLPNVALRSCAAVRGIVTETETAEKEKDGATGGGGRDPGDDRRLSFQIYLDAAADSEASPLRATHVISALPLPVLDSILRPPPPGCASTPSPLLPHLRANPHSSVTVLNLVFVNPSGADTTTTTPPPLHPPGFGYLIPRPEHGYGSSPPSSASASAPGPRPESESAGVGLLGVVFDTASLPEQDDDTDNATTTFTKMTAMLGGPYEQPSSSDAELVAAVLPRIAAHLGRHALPPPVHYAVHRNEESIPTYLVGHTARMGELRRATRERWGGRMKVVGAGVGGVSVADCVKAGRQAAYEVGAQIGN